MTMKPGDPAVRLYACEDDPKAPWCKQPIGKRCIDENGKPTTPHFKRWALGRGYADATNKLQPQINQLKAQNTDLGRRVTESVEDLAGVQHDLSAAAAEKVQLAQQLLAEQHAHQVDKDALEQALARIAELTKPDPVDPPPPPAPVPADGPGRLLIGAGGGNVDRSGDDSIDIDRPYYSGTDADITKLVARATKNRAAGILTWATFKLPVSWASAVAGGADDWFGRLVAAARALGFEVWIDLHHEPEGDDTDGDNKPDDTRLWAKLNDRLGRRLVDGKTGPVKFILCATGYSEEYAAAGGAGTWDILWPGGDFADYCYAIAYDNPYLKYGLPWKSGKKVADGTLDTTWSEGKASYIDKLLARAKKLGVKAAIGECGYSDEAFAKDPAWLDRMFLSGATDETLVAIVYFDSVLNSTRSWLLGAATSAKRLRFKSAAAAARAARAALRR